MALVSGTSHGRLNLVPLDRYGSFTYKPQGGFTGVDSFTYRAFDGTKFSQPIVVNLNVTDQAPIVTDANADVIAGDSYNADGINQPTLLYNATDPDANASQSSPDTLTVSLVTGPSKGALNLRSNGTFDYTPQPGFVGTDSFTYSVFDGTRFSTPATETLHVITAAPGTLPDSYQVPAGGRLQTHIPDSFWTDNTGVLGNDTDPNSLLLTVGLSTSVQHGSLTISSNGSFTYSPDPGFSGTDSFTYMAFNGATYSASTAVTITVGYSVPTTMQSQYFVQAGNVLTTFADLSTPPANQGILFLDSDPQGLPLSVNMDSGVSHGSLMINFDGSFVYTPNPGFVGVDSFRYRAFDGVSQSQLTLVQINVTGAPGPAPTLTIPATVAMPPGASTDVYMVRGGNTFTVSAATAPTNAGPLANPLLGVLANDYDPDGNPLQAKLLTPTVHGALVLNSNGTFSYTPLNQYVGLDSFTYSAMDGFGATSTTVTLVVTGAVPVANEDAYTVFPGQTLIAGGTGANPGVLANDVDVDGSPLTAVIATQPSHGTLILNSDGSFNYSPIGGYIGNDSFTYQDRNPRSAGTPCIVQITILANPVVAYPRAYTVHSGSFVFVPNSTGVLANVIGQSDGAFVRARLTVAPTNGSLQLNADGSFSFTPVPGYRGPDSFTYVIDSELGASAPAVVDLSVTDLAPIGNADAFTVHANSSLFNQVLQNDQDPEGDTPLNARLVTAPVNGTLILNSDGTFTYTPKIGYTGDDHFTYRATDGILWTGDVLVSLTVTNTVPVATPDYFMATHQGSGQLFVNSGNQGVLANDADPDGSPLRAQLLTGVLHGRLLFNSDGSFSYIANQGYIGQDTFTYRALTPAGVSAPTTVTLVMANVAPVATSQAFVYTVVPWDSSKTPWAQTPDLTGTLQPFTDNPTVSPPVFDADQDTLTFTVVNNSTGGELYLASDGYFSFKLARNSTSVSGSFSYYVSDGITCSPTFQVTLYREKVSPQSNPATFDINGSIASSMLDTAQMNGLTGAQSLSQAFANGAPWYQGNVLINVYNEGVIYLNAQLVNGPANGSLTLSNNGTFVYVPNNGFAGIDSFTYQTIDGGELSDIATITLNVVGSNPVAANDSYSVQQGSYVSGQVLDNDTSANGGPLSARVLTNVTHGTLSFTSGGNFIYYANRGFVGTDSFTYQAVSATGASGTATVTFSVSQMSSGGVSGTIVGLVAGVIDAAPALLPVPNVNVAVVHDQTLVRLPNDGVAGNAFADLLHPFTVSMSGVQHGTLTSFPSGAFIYRPNAGYYGADYFSFLTSDGRYGICNIRVTNRKPTTLPDTYATAAGTILTVASQGILGNDSDPDSDPLIAMLAPGFAPQHGTLTLAPNGAFTYQPDANFVGTDTFGYIAKDNVNFQSEIQYVTIYVTNAYPIARADSYSVARDQQLTINYTDGVTSNDTDANGELLRAGVIQLPAHGQLELQPSGAFAYTPTAGYVGSDFFSYQDTDGSFLSAITPVMLQVTATAPSAGDDSFLMVHDTVLTVSPLNGLLSNDASANGQALAITVQTWPSNGTLVLNPNGSFQYTPNHFFVGTDQFTYSDFDGQRQSRVATVTFSVTDTAPTVPNSTSTFQVVHDTQLIVSRWQGLLNNFADAEGDNFTVSQVAQPTHGTVTWLPSGAFVYTPNSGFVGTDVFTCQVSDGVFLSNTEAVTINVTADVFPVAVNDAYQTAMGTALAAASPQGLLANDSVVNGNPLISAVVNSVRHGSLTLNVGGSFLYVPDPGFVGTDEFTYQANDGTNLSAPATVVIQVQDAAPTVGDSGFALLHDSPLTMPAWNGVVGADGDGDPLTAGIAPDYGLVHHGALTISASGAFSYVPLVGFTGTDMFLVQVSDGHLGSSLAAIYFQVTDNAPTVAGTSYTVAQGNQLSIPSVQGIVANASDGDGDLVRAQVVLSPATGNLTPYSAGGFNYRASPVFVGSDGFWFRGTDGVRVSNAAWVSLAVTAGLTTVAPTYRYTPYQTLQVSAGQGVLSSDSSASGLPLTASVPANAGPTHGFLDFRSNGSFSYIPSSSWTGTDSFSYVVTDGQNTSGPILVQLAPAGLAAVDDFYSVQHDHTTVFGADAGVLQNDNPGLGGISTLLTNPATHGNVTLNTNGSFSYTPTVGYVGGDSFTYDIVHTATGIQNSNSATVHLSVTNNTPTAVDDIFVAIPGQTLTVPASKGLLARALDAGSTTSQVVSRPLAGTLALLPDGSFTYAPNGTFTGIDRFTYRLFDGTTTGNIATVLLEAPVAPVACLDTYSVTHDQNLIVAPGQGILANDVTTDGRPLMAILTSGPLHGTLVLSSDGSFDYHPALHYFGPDYFTYQAEDGVFNSITTTVTLQVTDQAPVAPTGSYTVHFGQRLVVSAAQGLLANVTDADGDFLTVAASTLAVDQPSHGMVTVNDDGSFVYTPNASTYTGPDSFTVHVSDGVNVTSETVNINVQDSAPLGQNKSYSVGHDRTLVVGADTGILANTSDSDGDPIAATNVTQPANGVLTPYSSGAFKYVPHAGYHGVDTFTYQLTDGALSASGTALGPVVTVTINVNETAPTVGNLSYNVPHDTDLFVPAATGVLATATDAEGDPIQAILPTSTILAHGNLTFYANGSFHYSPTPHYYGFDSFTFQLSDGLISNPVTVTLNVIDTAPQAQPTPYTVIHDQPLIVPETQGVLSFVRDSEGDTMTAGVHADSTSGTLPYLPAHGTLNLQPTGAFVYTPSLDFHGSDTFAIDVSDGAMVTGPVWITINVAESAPTGSAVSYSVPHDTSLVAGMWDSTTAAFQNNDGRLPDPTGNQLLSNLLSFVEGPGPSNPTDDSTPTGAGIVLIGDPASQQVPGLSSRPTSMLVPLNQNLLGGITDADVEPFTVTSVSSLTPDHGTDGGVIIWNSVGSFAYSPPAGYVGSVSFTFTVSDGLLSTDIPVTINVENTAPTAAGNSYNVPRNGFLSVVDPTQGLLWHSYDAEGDKLTASVVGVTDGQNVVTGPSHGSLTAKPDGTFYYIPAPGYSGPDSFSFKTLDGILQSNTATVWINVGGNDAPVARDAAYSISPFSATSPAVVWSADDPRWASPANQWPVSPMATLSVNTGTVPTSAINSTLGTQTLSLGLLANCTDPNGDPLELSAINNTQLNGYTTTVALSSTTALTVTPNGEFALTVQAGALPFQRGANGTGRFLDATAVTFTYQATDGSGQNTTGTVTINIKSDWEMAAEDQLNQQATEEKADLAAQLQVQKNAAFQTQAIDQFNRREQYLVAVAAAATPYQSFVTPAQQTFWQSLLTAAGTAAQTQATEDSQLQSVLFQTNATYAANVQAATSLQQQNAQIAAADYQIGQARAQATYQASIAAADASLQTTMNTAQATHDAVVAGLQDANNATQSTALATLQSLMTQYNVSYLNTVATDAANRDHDLAALRDSLETAQLNISTGLQTTLQSVFQTYADTTGLAAQTRQNAVQTAFTAYSLAVANAFTTYTQQGLDQNSTTPLNLATNAAYQSSVAGAILTYTTAVQSADATYNSTVSSARQLRDSQIFTATAGQNGAALSAINEYTASYQALQNAYDGRARAAQVAYDTAAGIAQNGYKSTVAGALSTAALQLQAANATYDQNANTANVAYKAALKTAQDIRDNAYATAQAGYETLVTAADVQQNTTLASAQSQADADLRAANVVFDTHMGQIGVAQSNAVNGYEAQAAADNLTAWRNLNTDSFNAVVARETSLKTIRDNNKAVSAGIQATYYSSQPSTPVPAQITLARAYFYDTSLTAANTFMIAQQTVLQAQSNQAIAQAAYDAAVLALTTAQNTAAVAQATSDAAYAALNALTTTAPGYAAALLAYTTAQAALVLAQAAIPPLQSAVTAALGILTNTQTTLTQANNAFLPAQRTYQLIVDQANLDYSTVVSGIVIGNATASKNAELARTAQLAQNQAQLVADVDAATATMVATVSDVVSAYGQAEGAAGAALQLGLLISNGTQTVQVAAEQAAYNQAAVGFGSTQTQSVITSTNTWKLAEKDAAQQLAIDQAHADELQGKAVNDALSDQQQTLAAIQFQWTTDSNTAIQQMTSTTSTAGQGYTLALGLAQNDWQTAMKVAQADFTNDLTVAQNTYQTELSQSVTIWREQVVAAQAGDATTEAAARATWTVNEAGAWSTEQTSAATWQLAAVAGWDLLDNGTHWSAYQHAVASAWKDFVQIAAPDDSALRIGLANQAAAFVATDASDVVAATSSQDTNFLGETTSANGVWTTYAGHVNADQDTLIGLQNTASQNYLITAAGANLTLSNLTAVQDSALTSTATLANSDWTGKEKLAANLQQSTLTSAYETLAVAQANAARDFAVTEANEASNRDGLQKVAQTTHDQTVVGIPASQQTDQWTAMWIYSPIQVNAAKTWANAVKVAAAVLKRNLNAADATLLETVAHLVAENTALKAHIDLTTTVSITTLRQNAEVQRWAIQLSTDQAATLPSFASVALQLPQVVQVQLTADANSSRDNSEWALYEQAANFLTGGRSRAMLLSPEFTRALNAVDGFFAGVADSLTAGLSTRARAAMWGDTATQNHSGPWFQAGQFVGQIMSIPLMAANPCAMGAVFGIGLRAINGAQLIGNGFNAVQNVMDGNYLTAGMDVLGMLGNLSKLAGACFTGDMQVMTRRGWIRWDALTEHDEVLSCDEHDPHGALSYKPIQLLLRTEAAITQVHVKGQVIRTTAEHPFYVWSKGWIAAKDLQPGDLLRSDDGQFVAVEEVYDTGVIEPVYNCSVAEYHTYFVGAADWGFSAWAHNDCHHIVSTYRNANRGFRRNWTQLSQNLLRRSGIRLGSRANKVHLNPHQGPHPELYHQRVYERLLDEARGKRGIARTNAINRELDKIASDLRANPFLLNGVGL